MFSLRSIKLNAIAGFCLASTFAVLNEWSLPEFCWSSWLAGLVYVWACILTACFQIIFSVPKRESEYHARFPFLSKMPLPFLFVAVCFAALAASFLVFRVYNYIFGFYGVFISVFARMEPLSMFGENGFINSDFFTPVTYLLKRFWPMAFGLILANWKLFIHPNPWKRLLLPLEGELVRLHFMVLLLPFFSLFAWFILGDRYQTLVILMMMGMLYLMPERSGVESNSAVDKVDKEL